MADGFGAPDSANYESLLHNRFASLLENDEQALEFTGQLGSELFQSYALLRAKNFSAEEARIVLTNLCEITLGKYAQGLLPFDGEEGGNA